MPLELASNTEDAAQEIDELSAETVTETQSPFSTGGRANALADLICRVTDNDSRQMSPDEFEDMQLAYSKLEDFEKLELRTELARREIYWSTTLEDVGDDLDDTNYQSYLKLSENAF